VDGPLRLGLIDQSPTVLDALAKWLALARVGELVGTATSLHEALATWHQPQLDALLLDVRHPSQLPLETLATFKEQFPNVKVVLMSHFSLDAEAAGCPVGVEAYLDKASLIDRLAPTLSRLFPHKKRST